MPKTARNGNSLRVTRRVSGRVSTRASPSPTTAPAERTSASRSDEMPAERIAFETVPFTAQRVAAVRTMA
jgi:hypothetical protein